MFHLNFLSFIENEINFSPEQFLFLHLPTIKKGAIAQLVEQRTENPCVAGSIPAGTTSKASTLSRLFCFS